MKKIKQKLKNVELPTDKIFKVSKLFEMHNWEIKKGNEFSLYNRFCETLNLFESEQQEFIINLTKNFLKIDIDEYFITLKQVLDMMYEENPKVFTSKIFILPLNFADEVYKPKSSTMMAYLFQHSSFKYEPYFAGRKIIVASSISSIPSNINQSSSSIVFLVDDYVGTGDTAEEALKVIIDNKVNKDKVVLISLVAQNEGIEKIRGMGFRAYAAYYRKKGISEEYKDEELEKYTKIMEDIEKKFYLDQKIILGIKDQRL